MNVNFTVFIDKILSGEKRQTIRKAGGKWENVKTGDKLTLYTGLRTKECRKLGEAEVEGVYYIEILQQDIKDVYSIKYEDNSNSSAWYKLTKQELQKLAKADGFENVDDFFNFLKNHYGDKFKGKIIKWKNFRKANDE